MTKTIKIITGVGVAVIAIVGITLLTLPNGNRSVTWDTSLISDPNVQVIIVKENSNVPLRYELVRVLATSTPNDGAFEWKPEETYDSSMYLEIGCATFPQVSFREGSNGCKALPLIALNPTT